MSCAHTKKKKKEQDQFTYVLFCIIRGKKDGFFMTLMWCITFGYVLHYFCFDYDSWISTVITENFS